MKPFNQLAVAMGFSVSAFGSLWLFASMYTPYISTEEPIVWIRHSELALAIICFVWSFGFLGISLVKWARELRNR
jgi:hypothetical protein